MEEDQEVATDESRLINLWKSLSPPVEEESIVTKW